MMVILHVFCCHIIQETPFTVDNWCLCLHSTEVQYVYKTYNSNISENFVSVVVKWLHKYDQISLIWGEYISE
jgi:hypothetical protein